MISYYIQCDYEHSNLLQQQSKVALAKAQMNDLSIRYEQMKQKKKDLIDFSYAKKIDNRVEIENNYNLQFTIDSKKNVIDNFKQSLNNLNNNFKDKEGLILGIQSLSSQINQFKQKIGHKHQNIMDSNIIKPNQIQHFIKFLSLGINLSVELQLLYRMTRDGFIPSVFHSKVDQDNITLSVIMLDDQTIIGGYTEKSWDGQGFKEDASAFLFNYNLNNKYKIFNQKTAIFTDPSHFTIFGNGDIFIKAQFSSSIFPQSYGNQLNKKELTNGKTYFNMTEFEVFRVKFSID